MVFQSSAVDLRWKFQWLNFYRVWQKKTFSSDAMKTSDMCGYFKSEIQQHCCDGLSSKKVSNKWCSKFSTGRSKVVEMFYLAVAQKVRTQPDYIMDICPEIRYPINWFHCKFFYIVHAKVQRLPSRGIARGYSSRKRPESANSNLLLKFELWAFNAISASYLSEETCVALPK